MTKLLSYSEFLDVKRIPTPQTIGTYKGDLLEIFISIFINELIELFRKDVNRDYKYIVENQSFIKGKINFPETITKNSFRRHLHYVRYEEFTEDILLNNIFKSVIKNLITRTVIKENKMKLRQGLLWLEDVNTIELNDDIWDKVKFNRFNSQYKVVFNMAKLFYYNSSPNLNKGDEVTYSFLVPLNQLYEKYLFKVLENYAPENMNIKYQGPTRFMANVESKNYMLLKPDITISIDNNVRYIIDAKYKDVVDVENKLMVKQSDVYQMLAYSVSYECDRIALVYPKFLDDESNKMLVSQITINNYDKKVTISVIRVDLEADSDDIAKELYSVLIE